jgi:hypothetical protein
MGMSTSAEGTPPIVAACHIFWSALSFQYNLWGFKTIPYLKGKTLRWQQTRIGFKLYQILILVKMLTDFCQFDPCQFESSYRRKHWDT